MLLHGFPERSTAWRHVAPLLHERGYRTLAMDQRGFSPGARPKRRRDYQMAILADDVAALIDEIGGPVHVVGHDWGAAVAWTVAMRARPGAHSLHRGLGGAPDGVPQGAWSRPPAAQVLVHRWPSSCRSCPSWLAAKPGGRFDRAAAQGRDDRGRRRPVPRGDRRRRRAADRVEVVPRDPARRPARAAGPRVSVPTTLVWSDQDVALARRGAERRPSGTSTRRTSSWCSRASRTGSPPRRRRRCADAILKRVAGDA